MSEEKEFTPWAELNGLTIEAVGRLADIVGAKTDRDTAAFGKVGTQVANELRAWIDWKEEGKKGRAKSSLSKKKKPLAAKDDPITMAARELATYFHDEYLARLNTAYPAQFMGTWKSIEKFMRGSAWRDVDEIKRLFLDWVEYGKSITTDTTAKWMFGKGGTYDFLQRTSQLKLLRTGAEINNQAERQVPVSLLVRWEKEGVLPDNYRPQLEEALASKG